MIKQRVVLWWMLLSGIVIHIFQSTNINVAIISMVRHRHANNEANFTGACRSVDTSQMNFMAKLQDKSTTFVIRTFSPMNEKITFDWTESQQNLILGSYYWLCWIVQFFGGLMSHKYGTKLVFGLSMFLSCLLSAPVPPFARISYKLVIALRVLQGAVSSIGFPAAIFPIIGAWAPPDETGRFSALFLGLALGVTFGYPIFGLIAQHLGWEWIFYFTAIAGTMWYIFWYFLVFDLPHKHPRISEEEKSYLKSSLQNRFAQEKSGIITGGAFFVRIFVQIIGATYTDGMIKHGIDENIVRKFAVWGGSIIPGIILSMVLVSSCHYWANVAILSGFIILTAVSSSGGQAALMNMSPNFSGVIQGINFTVGTTSGFMSPFLFGFLQLNYDTLKLYQYVFFVTACLNIVTGVLFVLFGNAKLQSWNSSIPKADNEQQKQFVHSN